MAAGAYGVSQGAASATAVSAVTIATPPTSSARRHAPLGRGIAGASATADARIDRAVEHVDSAVRGEDEGRGEEHRACHHWDVQVEHGLHREAPEPRPVEDRLGQHDPAHE